MESGGSSSGPPSGWPATSDYGGGCIGQREASCIRVWIPNAIRPPDDIRVHIEHAAMRASYFASYGVPFPYGAPSAAWVDEVRFNRVIHSNEGQSYI